MALTLAGIATGATEVVLHGPAFFVFRANGAGASQTGPEEDQGPGQPNAPGAHHNAKVIPVKDKAKVIPAKGKHAKKDPKQAGNPELTWLTMNYPWRRRSYTPIEGENGKWLEWK